MARLFSIGEVLTATGGRGEGLTTDGICSISIDSREIGPDALFVAIQGEARDGHAFVRTAIANGAVAALVSREKAADLGDKLIVVEDALEGLGDLARAARARSRAAIVGVTGSVGKTTTKEALKSILSAAGQTHASIKSYNNQWGVPLMLAGLPETAQFGVFEMGMNHAGEITPLTQMVRPHVAVITMVAAAHLEFFDSVADIARAKAEIFAGLEPGGAAVLNVDHDHAALLVELAEQAGIGRIVTYGFAEGADWHVEAFEEREDMTRARVVHTGEAFELVLPGKGRHMVINALGAMVAAYQLGVDQAVALQALQKFDAPEGRGAALLLGPDDKPLLLVDESYNANSASMGAALDVFSRQAAPAGRKILVLGEMLELGPQSPVFHAGLRDAVLASGADSIFLVGGPAMLALREKLGERVTLYAPHVDEIAERILSHLAYGDAVMVKGSKGVKLSGLVQKIKDRFS